jgi:hypothetical protein
VNCMRVSHQGRLNPLAVILIDRRPQILFRWIAMAMSRLQIPAICNLQPYVLYY